MEKGRWKMRKNGKRKEENEKLLFAFRKPLELFQGLPKWKFLPGKYLSHTGKKSGKVTLPPPLKIFPVTPLFVS